MAHHSATALVGPPIQTCTVLKRLQFKGGGQSWHIGWLAGPTSACAALARPQRICNYTPSIGQASSIPTPLRPPERSGQTGSDDPDYGPHAPASRRAAHRTDWCRRCVHAWTPDQSGRRLLFFVSILSRVGITHGALELCSGMVSGGRQPRVACGGPLRFVPLAQGNRAETVGRWLRVAALVGQDELHGCLPLCHHKWSPQRHRALPIRLNPAEPTLPVSPVCEPTRRAGEFVDV